MLLSLLLLLFWLLIKYEHFVCCVAQNNFMTATTKSHQLNLKITNVTLWICYSSLIFQNKKKYKCIFSIVKKVGEFLLPCLRSVRYNKWIYYWQAENEIAKKKHIFGLDQMLSWLIENAIVISEFVCILSRLIRLTSKFMN